ncbi:MAG: site-specific integrase [Acidobacteriota bacterium]|jgi:integrase
MAEDILRDAIPNSTLESTPTETKKRRKKILGISQRGNCWQIDTFYKGIRLRERCATQEMAEQNLRKMKTLIDEGRYMEMKRESKETVGQFAKRYLQWCRDIRQKAVNSKISHLESIQGCFGKDTLLSKIGRAEVEGYQALLISSPSKRKRAFRPGTVNRHMTTLRHMLNKAVEWNVISDHPCRKVKSLKENNMRTVFLSVEECKTLLDAASTVDEDSKKGACPGTTLKAVIELALNTGMRKSELLNLKWEHINLKQEYLEIVEQKNGEYDTIPLNQSVIEILRRIPRRLDSPYVFPGKIPGKPFVDLKGQYEKAAGNANLSWATFHVLRHTAASHMAMNGVPLTTIKEILRHKDFETTLRYAHLSPSHKKSAVDILGEALTREAETTVKTA